MVGPVDLGIEGIGPAVSIERGGSAEVFRAEQLAFGRTVAVKVIFAPTTDSNAYARFERECLALGAVSSHPHIVVVHDRGLTADDRPYITMEYRAGGSLADRLKSEGKLPIDDVIDIGIKVTDALAIAHDAGVLHRDVKPANLLLSAYGEPALADFGIARIDGGHRTTAGTFSASVAHAGREVLAGEEPSVRSDLYAVGSTLFELATGHAPYSQRGDDSVWQMINRIMTDPPPDPETAGIPQPLAAMLARLLSPDPNDRYGSARILHGDLVALKDRALVPPGQHRFDPVVGEASSDDENTTVAAIPTTAVPDNAPVAMPAVDVEPAPTPDLDRRTNPEKETPGDPVEPEHGHSPTDSPSSPIRRSLLVVATLCVIGALGAGLWLVLDQGSNPVERPQLLLGESQVGPLDAGTTYEIELDAAAEPDSTYRLLVDDVPTSEPDDELPPWTATKGRHQLVIEVTNDEISVRSEPIDVYVSDGPPVSGFRVNLASVRATADRWVGALDEFDRLVDLGHTDLELSLSARGEFWNFYVDGYGDDRQEAQAYCQSFGLGPNACYVASVSEASE